jgi:hypothetical protein
MSHLKLAQWILAAILVVSVLSSCSGTPTTPLNKYEQAESAKGSFIKIIEVANQFCIARFSIVPGGKRHNCNAITSALSLLWERSRV